ncbi:MAG: NADH:ubiquinone reductase (Na(+)-transporting) subunit F [Brumimicrobium sp.]
MNGLIITVALIVFLIIILVLVSILLFVKAKITPEGKVKISINEGQKVLEVDRGGTLLSTLANQKVFLASACGGGGTCIECTCYVDSGGGSILPTEEPHFSRKEIAEGIRLSCQVKVKEDMEIRVEESVLGVKEWEAKVVSNYNVASFIKEFIVEVPEDMNYKPGGYIQIRVPKCVIDFKDIDITAHPKEHPGEPDKFHAEWDKFKLWPLQMKNDEDVVRAYSMASYPAEGRRIMLNVRIATPPFDRKAGTWMKVNPGVASSYIFSLKEGDTAIVSGPYGEFFIKETDAEMLYIGGGAGMAPMRSHLYHLFKTLKTGRKVTYWYGGRSRRELFYIDHFRELEDEFPNFKFFMVLSEPLPEDNWVEKKNMEDTEGDGFVGFVHQAVIDQYLTKHEEPEDIEFYFCGPPLMNDAVVKMCDEWGVPEENISFDDFGG